MGLAEMGLVGDVDVGAGDVVITLRLTSPFCHMIGFMKKEAIARVEDLPAVRSVTVHGDAGLDWSPSMISAPARARREERLRQMAQRSRAAPCS